MSHFPIFLDLAGRAALVVGGGERAAQKVRLLARSDARITVVARRLTDELAAQEQSGVIAVRRRGFVAGDVGGQTLVIAATGIGDVDLRVAEAARTAGVPINAVDRPDLSSFIVPAIIDRDPVVVAVSSGGAAPVLARRLRERIEALLPARLGELARFAERFRATVAAVIPAAGRRGFWERFFDGPVSAQVLAGAGPAARESMLGLINARSPERAGAVAIVGAGPGDPDLLTLRALRLLQEADVIVHDRLVGPAILDLARRDAELIYVGKARGDHSLGQDGINALLAQRARAGQRVVRLKGGDPFIFGRGGEEVEHLRRAGISVQVVPGITAAIGCAAAAGLPLTHREVAQSLTFVTAHACNGEPRLDWSALAASRQTVVVYMGVAMAGRIAARLIQHGRAPSTPVAVIENGTLPSQRVLTGTLRCLETLVVESGIEGPAAIVVGEVVSYIDPAVVEPAPERAALGRCA